MPQRTLSEEEFNTIRDGVLRAAPPDMSEDDFNRYIGPVMDGAIAKAENMPATEGGALGRFASNLGAQINPLAIAKGLWNALPIPQALGGAGVITGPLNTAISAGEQMLDQGRTAMDYARQGRPVEATGHAVAAAIPFLGPAAAEAGEQMRRGDVAGGIGAGLGLVTTALLPAAARGVKAGIRNLPAAVASRADRMAASRIADVMSPKIGPNKTRFGNQAEKIAPALAKDLAADGAPLTREGFHGQVQTKLAAAEGALDAAANARNANQVIHAAPVLRALRQRRADLTSQTHQIGSFKAGSSVVPSPNAARVAQIDQAISEIEQLGPVVNYEALRRIRQAYDGPAKAVYSPSMTADYLKSQGGKLGAADVTGVLRETLARMDPNTAAANAQYSLYRAADDVLTATAEVERTRPRVGRQIIARMGGMVVGSSAAGVPGAIAGYIGGPILDSALASGATTQLKTAAMLTKLSAAIRAGRTSQVASLSLQLRRLGKSATSGVSATVGRQPATESATP